MAARGARGREVREGFELLDDVSSESEQEHFSMSPLGSNNNRKQNERHWTPSRKKKGEKCCSLGLSLLFLLVVIVSACMAVLAVYTYSLHNQLVKLQDQVNVMAQEDAKSSHVQMDAPQSIKQISQKQQILDKTIQEIQERDLKYIMGNITQLFQQLSAVNNSLVKLNQKKAAESVVVGTRSLEQQVATLGSSVQSLQTELEKYTSQQAEHHEKIQLIEKNGADISSINHTMMSHIHEQMIAIQHLQNKTSAMDLRLLSVDNTQGSQLPNIEALVYSAIHATMENYTFNSGDVEANIEAISRLETITTGLRDNITSVNNTLSMVKQQIEQNSGQSTKLPDITLVDPDDYIMFKNDTWRRIKSVDEKISGVTIRMSSLEHTLYVLKSESRDADSEYPEQEPPSSQGETLFSTGGLVQTTTEAVDEEKSNNGENTGTNDKTGENPDEESDETASKNKDNDETHTRVKRRRRRRRSFV